MDRSLTSCGTYDEGQTDHSVADMSDCAGGLPACGESHAETPPNNKYGVDTDFRFLVVSKHLIFCWMREDDCEEVTLGPDRQQDYMALLHREDVPNRSILSLLVGRIH